MRRQHDIWEDEHRLAECLPGIGGTEPGEAVVAFGEFLKQCEIPAGSHILDIGCGSGRNALYFARQGFRITAMDYSENALAIFRTRIHEAKLADLISIVRTGIDQPWPFPDDHFDLAVDNYSSIDIETLEGRAVYRDELLRTLRPGGYALVAVVAAADQLEQELMRTTPGTEFNSTIWPNGKFQKNYDEPELRSFYQDFEILDLHTTTKRVTKLGKTYDGLNFWMTLEKTE